jgi:hypothetical protein
MIETRISSARARVADGGALYRLLEDVPQAEEIRARLAAPFFTRRWHQLTERSFWIASDGTTVLCLTVSGLSADEMVAVWVSFDDYRKRSGFTLSAHSLSEVIQAELGLSVELVN